MDQFTNKLLRVILFHFPLIERSSSNSYLRLLYFKSMLVWYAAAKKNRLEKKTSQLCQTNLACMKEKNEKLCSYELRTYIYVGM